MDVQHPVPEDPIKSLPDDLIFKFHWWWDPAPPWVVRFLEKEVIIELAKIQLEFQHAVLTRQAEAIQQVTEVIGRSRS